MSTATTTPQPLPTGGQIADQILASHGAANLANAVTAIYGLTGSGKSNLADTAIEYAWEEFQKISLVYAADLGGFGTKRLALVRAGIAHVWDPRNHQDPFATMEAASLGAFPAYLLPGGGASQADRERGYAPPDAELVYPHRTRWTMVDPQGHENGSFYTPQQMVNASITCPQCGHVCTPSDPAIKVTASIVRSKGFALVGLRVYDSMTALNEWGMADLQEQSAKGMLPAGAGGGSALGSADALVSGGFKFGTSSKAQFGFLQQRSYGWIANIRSIPDQVVPAVVTFMVESSKGDDESGGIPVNGPKIAGNARTSSLGGWVGNLLYAAREPKDTTPGSPMVYRLWLTNHVDPRDPRGVPYMAKHRGTPLGMPDYYEDEPGKPWETVNLGKFFRALDAQVGAVSADLAKRYPNAPAFSGSTAAQEETVVRAVAGAALPTHTVPGAVGGRVLPGAPSAPAALPGVQAAPSMAVAQTAPAPAKRAGRAVPGAVAAPAAAAPTPAPTPAPPVAAPVGGPSVATATAAPVAAPPRPPVVAPPVITAPTPALAQAPAATTAAAAPAAVDTPPATAASTAAPALAAARPPARRTPRPPVG